MIDNRTAPYAALVLRLALSFFFFAHLIRKFAVIGFDPWWTGLVKQGYPGAVLGYTVAIEFAGGAPALGIAAATLAQLCMLLPLAGIAAGVLVHGSGTALYTILARRQSDDGRAGQ